MVEVVYKQCHYYIVYIWSQRDSQKYSFKLFLCVMKKIHRLTYWVVASKIQYDSGFSFNFVSLVNNLKTVQ